MKRTVLAALCGVALAVGAIGHSRAGESADKSMADRYFEAARGGDATAQFYLGALYAAGVGRPQSDVEAFRWFLRAAEQGHAQAALIVGGLYVVGRGTPKDNVSGYKWASIAASTARVNEFRNGARQLKTILETRLTRAEIRQATSEAKSREASTPRSEISHDEDRRDRGPPQTLPKVSNQPPNTVVEPPKPSGSSDAVTEKKLKSDFHELLDRLPSSVRKRMGL